MSDGTDTAHAYLPESTLYSPDNEACIAGTGMPEVCGAMAGLPEACGPKAGGTAYTQHVR